MSNTANSEALIYRISTPTWDGVFEIENPPTLTWLVGPNGAGKSFALANIAHQLQSHLVKTNQTNKVALISIKRTQNLPDPQVYRSSIEQTVNNNKNVGIIESNFYTSISRLALDLALRIRVQATLEAQLQRRIRMEFVEGSLHLRMEEGVNVYSHHQEAQGIVQMIHHLAVIYDDFYGGLIFDEPEISLHPQQQAWLIAELRKANKPTVIATHSPAMLDVRTLEDLRGVICFHGGRRPPTRFTTTADNNRTAGLLPRLTADGNTFYFTSTPVFCEGYQDAVVFSEIMRGIGIDHTSIGNPIPTGGKDAMPTVLELARTLGKTPIAILDLDAIFDDRLTKYAIRIEACVKHLVSKGHADFTKLRSTLISHLDTMASLLSKENAPSLFELVQKKIEKQDKRRAVLEAIARKEPLSLHKDLISTSELIQGAIRMLLEALEKARIFLLPQGELEHHLPGYQGDLFNVSDKEKQLTVERELAWFKSETRKSSEIKERYASLVSVLEKLQTTSPIDYLPLLKLELSDVLHQVIKAVSTSRIHGIDDVLQIFPENRQREVQALFEFTELTVKDLRCLRGIVRIKDRFNLGDLYCGFDQTTQVSDPTILNLYSLAEES